MKKFIELQLFLASIGLIAGDNSVLLLSHNQLITSSTLRWVSASNGQIPENAVEGATKTKASEYSNVNKIHQNEKIVKAT